ncbi:hypothetical protein SAMN04488030_0145 [Aliiroseovarius halocynthiae]|nr:hypothetical protein SAMN04488030_0145 [Aliiroseovarius halocynthiae]
MPFVVTSSRRGQIKARDSENELLSLLSRQFVRGVSLGLERLENGTNDLPFAAIYMTMYILRPGLVVEAAQS